MTPFPRWRRTACTVLLALLAPLLMSCGGGSNEAGYCAQLEGDQNKFAELFSGPSSGLVTTLPMLKVLAEKAPDDLTDEWQSLINAIQGLADALRHAGVKPSGFVDGKPPTGLSVAETREISDAADVISSDAVVSAASGIDQQARDVCKIQLGLS